MCGVAYAGILGLAVAEPPPSPRWTLSHCDIDEYSHVIRSLTPVFRNGQIDFHYLVIQVAKR